jgi:hypothetical protein
MKVINFPKVVSLAVAGIVGLAASMTTSAADEPINNSPAAPAPVPAANSIYKVQYVPPTAQVEKLVKAGIGEDVIKAYVASSRFPFNLTPDEIIHLQSIGISGPVLTEMLDHDKSLQDAATAPPPLAYTQPQPGTLPPNQQPPTYATETPDYYNDLAGYGNWNYDAGYGWGWQPYPWLGYDYYPWGLLGYGGWIYWPNRGWCWRPNSHFHDFGHGRDFDGHRFGGFTGNRFDGRFNHSFAANRSFSGFHGGFSPSAVHSGGGFSHFGGGHMGGFAGGHAGGFSGGHMGGFGGGHSGGFGGGHGGGGGHR